MLANHESAGVGLFTSVVIRDDLARGYQNVADSRLHVGINGGSEPALFDRFPSRKHHRSRTFAGAPPVDNGFPQPRAGIGFEMQLEATRLSRNKSDAVDERGIVAKQDVRVRGDIQNPVICSEDEPFPLSQSIREWAKFTVESFQPSRPRVRLPAMRVSRLIEFGNVNVNNPLFETVQGRAGRRKAIRDGPARHEVRTPQDGLGESGMPIALLRHDDARNPRVGGLLENCGHSLPGRGIELVVPSVQLIYYSVVRRVKHRIADEPVLPGHGPRGERRDIRSGRRGATRGGNRSGRDCPRHITRVTQSFPQT